jgi:Fur family transcriptional regulator, ferric uptake regulator
MMRMIFNLIHGVSYLPMSPGQPSAATRLAQAGLRSTRQRLLVLETLAAEPHDATAQEIYARLRHSGEPVGLATVYRTLSLLSESSVVDEFAHRPGETCYRLCGEGHHHHLVCAHCHGVAELEGCQVDGWLREAAREHGFAPTGHTLEVTGLCADCQAA